MAGVVRADDDGYGELAEQLCASRPASQMTRSGSKPSTDDVKALDRIEDSDGNHDVNGRIRLGVKQEFHSSRFAPRFSVRAGVCHIDVWFLPRLAEDGPSVCSEDSPEELPLCCRGKDCILLRARIPVAGLALFAVVW